MIRNKGLLYSVLAAFFFGVSIPASKIAIDNLPVFFLEGVTMNVSMLFFLLIFLFYKDKKPWQFRKLWKEYFALTILSVFIPTILIYFGFRYGQGVNASVLLRFEVFVVLVYSILWMKERPSTKQIFGIFLGFFGTFIFVTGFSFQFVWGDIFVILSACLFGVFPIMIRVLNKFIPLAQINFIRVLPAAILFPILSMAFEEVDLVAAMPYYPYLLAMAILVFVFGVGFYSLAIKNWQVWKASFASQFGSVIFGYIAAVTILSERLIFWQWVGGVVIMVSLFIVLWPNKYSPKKA